MSSHNSNQQQMIGLGLAALVIIAFLVLIFSGKSISPEINSLVRFLAAICAGFSAYIFTGEMEIGGKHLGISFKATAGFGVFLAVFFFFNYGQFIPDFNKFFALIAASISNKNFSGVETFGVKLHQTPAKSQLQLEPMERFI